MHGTVPSSNDQYAIIAVMGATGTGKSTFIKHVTGDEKINIGKTLDSETTDVQISLYTDPAPCSRTHVFLVDTPGFDDSRDGISDTDILEKITLYLQHDGGQKLNGLIYMHRISDNRMGGMSRKNLKLFRELCGDTNLCNVYIVTTLWDRVTIEEGTAREEELACGAFKDLIAAGAKMVRQDNGKDSALGIVSELRRKAMIELQLLKEVKQGKSLEQTSAGQVINEEIMRLQKKHEKEMMGLKKELEEAAAARDDQLRALLAAERKELEEKVAKLESDRIRLQETHEAELKKTREQGASVYDGVMKRLNEMQTKLDGMGGGGCQIQ